MRIMARQRNSDNFANLAVITTNLSVFFFVCLFSLNGKKKSKFQNNNGQNLAAMKTGNIMEIVT